MSLGKLSRKDIKDLFSTAKEHFEDAQYALAEPILEQLIVSDDPSAETYHMLATIYFDKGKFKKAIRTYRRALEIDPTFSDASVGLSILLNDLGRYEEGKQVFINAQAAADNRSQGADAYAFERLAMKHDEIGELYFQSKRYEEALKQYEEALKLTQKRNDVRMKIIECHLRMDNSERGLPELRSLILEQPSFLPARLKLGLVLYQSRRVPEAIEQWEAVLLRDPDHPLALQYLQMAQQTNTTELN
jgi:tetratricopeptide (TPR) repeat protein